VQAVTASIGAAQWGHRAVQAVTASIGAAQCALVINRPGTVIPHHDVGDNVAEHVMAAGQPEHAKATPSKARHNMLASNIIQRSHKSLQQQLLHEVNKSQLLAAAVALSISESKSMITFEVIICLQAQLQHIAMHKMFSAHKASAKLRPSKLYIALLQPVMLPVATSVAAATCATAEQHPSGSCCCRQLTLSAVAANNE
jgi:hypothetical protein